MVEEGTKKKYKSKSKIEDPQQFHAKPKDLSLNALERPREIPTNTTSKVFSSSEFSTFSLEPRLVKAIQNTENERGLGLKFSTTVQSVVIPTLLKQRQNILIKSQTGSGKTLAYLIPVINDLMTLTPQISRADGCHALIMAPTRELCTQISEVLQKLTQCCVWIVGGCITGGERRKSEKERLRKGITVLVGTPGRLLDHLSTSEAFNLTKLRWMIMDEVDRLLDMGKYLFNTY